MNVNRLKEQLLRREQELDFIDEFSRELSETRTSAHVLELLADKASKLVTCDSLVIYVDTQGELRPECVQSPWQDRLDNAALLGLDEPIVLESWKRRQPLLLTSQKDSPSRIFQSEPTSATFLLDNRGLVYMGLSKGSIPASSSRLLSALSRHAGIALQSVERQAALTQALKEKDAAIAELTKAHRKLADSEQSLIQSSKLAAVGQLAAGVAHELNTPLATVLLEVEFLEMEMNGQEEFVATLQKMARELLRAQEIVSKLLYYSTDARKGDKPVDLNQVVADSLELVAFQLSQAGVEILAQFAPSALMFCGNANEAQQITLNLLLNAKDASKGQPSPKVRVETHQSPDGHCTLAVTDNGNGVDAEIADRIFDPFFTTKEVGQGTGLGLSLSRQLANRQGGSLELGEAATGAQFILSIPRLNQSDHHA